ncbi:MAG: hypothetical protein ACRDBL_06150 [Rhabdaerophilum sp.]
MTDKPNLERRSIVKMLLGIGAVTLTGGALLMPGQAEAAPALPAAPQMPEPASEPIHDMAADSEKPETLETQYYYRRRVYRRPVYVRRRVYVRPRRRVVVRRRPVYRRRVVRRRYYY